MSDQSPTHRDLASVAAALNARVDGHEDVCAERMRRIDERLHAGDVAREAMRHEMRAAFAALKQSLRDIYARLWWAAAAVIAAQTGAIGWFLVTAGLPGAN